MAAVGKDAANTLTIKGTLDVKVAFDKGDKEGQPPPVAGSAAPKDCCDEIKTGLANINTALAGDGKDKPGIQGQLAAIGTALSDKGSIASGLAEIKLELTKTNSELKDCCKKQESGGGVSISWSVSHSPWGGGDRPFDRVSRRPPGKVRAISVTESPRQVTAPPSAPPPEHPRP